MTTTIPDRAEVVIIGGGVVGCSIAWHLCKLGITDVVLLERKQLTCGTTWHAAGLIGQLRSTRQMTELAQYTAEMIGELEKETGQATGFKQNGAISVALNKERLEELKRMASMARNFGLEVDVIGPDDIYQRYPQLCLDGVEGGIFLHKDGQCNPVDLTQAYAKGARMRGAKILEGIKVTGIIKENNHASGVLTEQGEIRADTVVIAAGMWSHALGQSVGANLPLHAAEHFYIVTDSIKDLPHNLPVLRVPDECIYVKEDAGKILLGCFEPVAKPWGMNGISDDFCFDSLPADREHFMPLLERAVVRLPMLEQAGIQTWFNGPESFTPDNRYLLGETPEVQNLFVACGFNSTGIQSSGGAGKALAQWIKDRRPPMDLIDVDVQRMQSFQGSSAYRYERTVESLGLLYQMHWPFYQYRSARGAKRSPFYDRLKAQGAVYGEMGGWERPNWFAPKDTEPVYQYSYYRQNWFNHTASECRATRDSVALYEQSSMTKFILEGRDALNVLERLSCNLIDVPPGRVVYTQWLNERGGIEADVTITRIAEQQFMVVSSAFSHTRDFAHLRRAIEQGSHCFLTEQTAALPMLSLMGPNSRMLLQRLAPQTDFSNQAFPFGHSKRIEIGYAEVRASRITYVGELGWELYIPAEFALHVLERILEAGSAFGLQLAGMHAMNACRMEKGYRSWGHDIGVEDNNLEAGLGFSVAWDKPIAFIGREALLRQREAGIPKRRLLHFRLTDTDRLLYGEEPIWLKGKRVGAITSGMYGHRLGASLGLGYVTASQPITADWLRSQSFEIEIGWQRYCCEVSLRPFYDADGLRIKS